MTQHAFKSPPDYLARIDRHAWAGAITVAGVEERWTMPVALFEVRNGFDNQAEPDEIGHHTIKWRASGARVHARNGLRGIASDPMAVRAVCLQARGSGARYWAAGKLTCAHIYWQDDFVRSVAIDVYGCRGDHRDLLLEDVMFAKDIVLCGMTELYFARALSITKPSALEMDARSLAICSYLVARYSSLTGRDTRSRHGKLEPRQLTRAIEYMVHRLHVPLRLADIAREAGVSTYEFCRGFHATTGRPPHRWVTEYRLERARQLLASSNKSVTEIAAELSYDDPSYFARVFRREIGCSPLHYRNTRQT